MWKTISRRGFLGIAALATIVVMAAALRSYGSGSADASESQTAADRELALKDIYTSVAITLEAATYQVTPTPTLRSTATSFPASTIYVASFAPATADTRYHSPASGCDNAAYVRDVTIADGTELAPGETFAKTWEFLNTGSCDWSSSYSIAFVSGDAMDGSETRIRQVVSVGDHSGVSVLLTAPKDEGTYKGYWRLENAGGTAFGEPVFVQILVVPETVANTPTPTTMKITSTPTETETPTASLATSTPIPTKFGIPLSTSTLQLQLTATPDAMTR